MFFSPGLLFELVWFVCVSFTKLLITQRRETYAMGKRYFSSWRTCDVCVEAMDLDIPFDSATATLPTVDPTG